MAVTAASPTVQSVFGDKRVYIGPITFDNSYPTGGEPVTPSLFGFAQSLDAVIVLGSRAVQTWTTWYNPATGKLVAQITATGIEVVDTTDLSTAVFDVLAIGE